MNMNRRNFFWAIEKRSGFQRDTVCIAWLLMLSVLMHPAVEGAEYVDRIVAVVNDDIITLSELNEQAKPYTEQILARHLPAAQRQEMLFTVRDKVLNGLIDQKLTDQEFKRADINVSDAEIDATIERIKDARFLTDEDLRHILEQQGLSMEAYRSQIKTQILRMKLINIEVKSKIVITQEDIAAYYKNHSDLYGGEKKYHLRNILLKPPVLANETEEEAFRKKMATIVENLKRGASFEEMAREYSQSPLAADGGDLGAFELKALSPQIRDAVEKLKSGQFTDFLSTDQGYQLFYIEDITESPAKPLKEISGEIHEKLFNEIVDSKFQSWLKDLRKKSHIRIIK